MALPAISQLAIPAASVLICFLSYSSQFLFLSIEPEPLDLEQTLWFNALVLCIWISYIRACKTDPGRVPSDWQPAKGSPQSKQPEVDETSGRTRWCRRCEASKPPRSHHCKTCKRWALHVSHCMSTISNAFRCIPKMDHHCPWTDNCVSHFTLPHFIRSVFYATVSMTYLEYFLYIRAAVLWRGRNLPSVRFSQTTSIHDSR
jgi:palmitoyltransferase